MKVKTILCASTISLCGLAGYVLGQVFPFQNYITSAHSLVATSANNEPQRLQDWAGEKVSIGLGFPLDAGPEKIAERSRDYTPVEWGAWRTMRDRYLGAAEIRIVVLQRPSVSPDPDNVEERKVDVPIEIQGKCRDTAIGTNITKSERTWVHMIVTLDPSNSNESYKLVGMTVDL